MTIEGGAPKYLYGHIAENDPRLEGLVVKSIEAAGTYDRNTNLVEFTEATSIEEGVYHRDKPKS